MTRADNVHAHEIHKFGSQADRWWDPTGEFKTLHQVNPLRLQYIQEALAKSGSAGGFEKNAPLAGKKAVDVGCGGGILSEALARQGADTLGIDLAAELLDVADLHGLESGVKVAYRKISAESLAAEMPAAFDVVTCMEMLEHVPNPESVIRACAAMAKPGGLVFFSTLNKTLKAYLLAVVAAEYLLRMIPKGTHDYDTFIRPSQLEAWARHAGLELVSMAGIGYNPLTQGFFLCDDVGINYLAAFRKPDDT